MICTVHESAIFRIGTPDQRTTYVHIVGERYRFCLAFLRFSQSYNRLLAVSPVSAVFNRINTQNWVTVMSESCVCAYAEYFQKMVHFVSLILVFGVLFGRSAVQLLFRQHFHSFYFSFPRNTGDVAPRTHDMLYYKLLRDVEL